MQLEILKGIEFEVIVKAFLVISVASFYFSVMPRCFRTNCLVLNVQFFAEQIKWMYPIRFRRVGELTAVVGLNDLGSISKEYNGTFREIDGGIAALLCMPLEHISRPFAI